MYEFFILYPQCSGVTILQMGKTWRGDDISSCVAIYSKYIMLAPLPPISVYPANDDIRF